MGDTPPGLSQNPQLCPASYLCTIALYICTIALYSYTVSLHCTIALYDWTLPLHWNLHIYWVVLVGSTKLHLLQHARGISGLSSSSLSLLHWYVIHQDYATTIISIITVSIAVPTSQNKFSSSQNLNNKCFSTLKHKKFGQNTKRLQLQLFH